MKLLDDAGSLEENNIKDIFCFTVPRMRRKVRDIGYYNYNLFPLLTITACFSLASFSFFSTPTFWFPGKKSWANLTMASSQVALLPYVLSKACLL